MRSNYQKEKDLVHRELIRSERRKGLPMIAGVVVIKTRSCRCSLPDSPCAHLLLLYLVLVEMYKSAWRTREKIIDGHYGLYSACAL